VTTKTPTAGSEIDSYCTKCKLDLNHRIIAMVGEKPKKVECLTCKTHHLYRIPKSQAPVAKKRATRGTAAQRVTLAMKAERELLAAWENAISGQPTSAFRSYGIKEVFSPGELIRHTKFGDGLVARVIDRGKVEVLFQAGMKTMAHGQP